jgi:GTPase SAR1 family protein
MSASRHQDEDEDEVFQNKQYKVIFLGDGAVGKTSIILRFTQDHFDPEQKYKQTIGLDFFMKEVVLSGFSFLFLLLISIPFWRYCTCFSAMLGYWRTDNRAENDQKLLERFSRSDACV